jgi:hypothetical protein
MDVWRLYYRFLSGRVEHVDVEGYGPCWDWHQLQRGRAIMRERHGDRGYWLEAWQPLIVPAGDKPPKLRRRIVLAWRRRRRNLAHA